MTNRHGAGTNRASIPRPGRDGRPAAMPGCHSFAQRLACTIARIPARTAGGRLDHASTTAARAGSAAAVVVAVVVTARESLPFQGETGSATASQIRHRRLDSDRSLCFEVPCEVPTTAAFAGVFCFLPRSGRADRLQGIGRGQSLATQRLAIPIGRDGEPAPTPGSPCPWSLSPRLPGKRIPSAVEDSKHLYTICEHDEVDDISKLLQPCGAHIFPNLAMQLRRLLDAGKHFPNTGKDLISEANANGLELVAGLLDIDLCFVPQDDRQTHEPPSSRSSTSRHGVPTPGDSAARARRVASSATCQSGMSRGSTCSGRLSQICSMRSRRSRTLRRSMPNESMRTATRILLRWTGSQQA